MRKSRKVTNGRRHDPIFTHPEWGHKGDEPNGGGWGGDFSFGWMDIGAKKKIWKFHLEIQILISFSSTQSRKHRRRSRLCAASCQMKRWWSSFSKSHFLNERREVSILLSLFHLGRHPYFREGDIEPVGEDHNSTNRPRLMTRAFFKFYEGFSWNRSFGANFFWLLLFFHPKTIDLAHTAAPLPPPPPHFFADLVKKKRKRG